MGHLKAAVLLIRAVTFFGKSSLIYGLCGKRSVVSLADLQSAHESCVRIITRTRLKIDAWDTKRPNLA